MAHSFISTYQVRFLIFIDVVFPVGYTKHVVLWTLWPWKFTVRDAIVARTGALIIAGWSSRSQSAIVQHLWSPRWQWPLWSSGRSPRHVNNGRADCLANRSTAVCRGCGQNSDFFDVGSSPATDLKLLLWPPYVIGGHYIFTLWFLSIFYLSIFFFYSSPNLSGHRLDVYHTSTHGVALVRI